MTIELSGTVFEIGIQQVYEALASVLDQNSNLRWKISRVSFDPRNDSPQEEVLCKNCYPPQVFVNGDIITIFVDGSLFINIPELALFGDGAHWLVPQPIFIFISDHFIEVRIKHSYDADRDPPSEPGDSTIHWCQSPGCGNFAIVTYDEVFRLDSLTQAGWIASNTPTPNIPDMFESQKKPNI